MLLLRVVAVIGVIVLVALGLLLVFGAGSQQLQETLIKTAWVVGIFTAASLLISLVTKKQV